jgi:hypothetical protein
MFKMKNKFSIAMTLAVIMAMLVNSLALADPISNNIDTTVDPTLEVRTITAGGSTNVGFYDVASNTDPAADANGCNSTGVTPSTVTLNVPAGVTATPASFNLIGCGTANAVSVSFTSSTPGSYLIGIASVTGGKPGSLWNTSPAPFTLTVNPPPDSTPPVISYVVTPSSPDGSNGWYKSNVSLVWSVTDPQSAVTKTGCVDQNITSDQAATTYSCSASSAGGSAGPVTVTIKRDATAPSISGSASPAPNGAGWNNTDVSVTFSCNDGTSGVASCGPNQTLTSNGAGQSATGNAVDNAGNSASANVSNIDIDKELPSITSSVPAANANGWYNGSVTASFVCDDEFSGVDFCEPDYTFNGEGSVQSYTGHASDFADNENSTNVSVNIDTTAPVIELVSRTPANANGWNNGNVDLEWSCADSGSGVVDASVFASVTTEGENQSATGTCEDLAGNTASNEQTSINIDQTAPSISAQRDTVANANGWNNTDVASSYTASDALSGLASPATGSFTFTSEGAAQSHTFTVTDLAGNSASDTVDNVNIDKTAPTISGAPDRAPNGNGWYGADVIVSFICADGLSGLDTCSDPSTLGEGENQSVAGTATDLAGNSATATVSGINVDKTAPTATASASPSANGSGWNNSDVTVSFSGSDALSGIDFCDDNVVLSSEGADQSASGSCTDKAGNVSTPATASGINIDKTAPTASASASPAANGNGWNNSDVTVSFSGTDSLSGIASCDAAVVLSSEGAGQSASGSCTDQAGNGSTPATASNINIDKTAPSVSLVGGPSNGSSYYFGSVPAAPTCSASDALSDLAAPCSVSGYSNAVGNHTVTASATDQAGNSASASATYSVLAWTPTGFYQPVDMSGVWNIVKGGQTVPLKFEIFAGPTELTNTSAVQSVQAYRIACTAGSGEDAIETVTTGGTNLRYDATSGQFIFNWQTPRQPSTCYKVVMTAQDGSMLTAFFKLK